MKALYLIKVPASSTAGGKARYEVVLREKITLPELSDNDVMVKISACALARVDTKTVLQVTQRKDVPIPIGFSISGNVTKVGSDVKLVSLGDEVAGILPMDTMCSGCADHCIIPEYCLVKKPKSVSHVDCAAVMGPGVAGLTAILNQVRLQPGVAVLIFSGCSATGIVLIQLCIAYGARVIVAVDNNDGVKLVSSLEPQPSRIIDMASQEKSLVEICLQETGGMGVDYIIDDGVDPGYSLDGFVIEPRSFRTELEEAQNRHDYESEVPSKLLPTKQQILNCLAVHGHWITTQPELQLDPPEAQVMYLKSASLHFLFNAAWLLSGRFQGKYLNMLSDVISKLEEGVIKPYVHHTVSIQDAVTEMKQLGGHYLGSVIMTTSL